MISGWRNVDRSGFGWLLWGVDLGARVLAAAILIYALGQGAAGEVPALFVAAVLSIIGGIAGIVRARREPSVTGAPAGYRRL